MPSTPHPIKTPLRLAEADLTGNVLQAREDVVTVLKSVDGNGLDDAGRHRLAQATDHLNQITQGFQEQYPQLRASLRARVDKVRQQNTVRKLVQWVLLVLGLLLLVPKWWLGLLLLLVLLVGRVVAKKVVTRQALGLQQENESFVGRVLAQLGRPHTALEDASGLCAEADALYFASLDQHGQSLEQQRRHSDRQMAQMQANHAAQMAQQQAAMDQQKASMEALIREHEDTNDALYGKPGIIGSALRTRDRIKRQQG